jgi:hypothetical protein
VSGFRSHYSLEHPPEHIRGYLAVLPLRHSEVKSLEQPVERISPELVGNVCLKPSFQGVWLEEAAIQEWNRAKCSARSAPNLLRAVQGAKEERAQEVAMYPSLPS